MEVGRTSSYESELSDASKTTCKNSWRWPARHPGGKWLYQFFLDDTDIPLRRLLLADSSKLNAWALPRISMGRIRSFYSGKKAWRNINHFFIPFLRMERWQHKNTDTNPCQTVLRASQNQASTLSIQESPAAALNLSSGNAGSCCKGWYPCFYLIVLLFTNLQNSFRFSRENRGGKSGACTGIHGVLSVKAAFRPEWSRYTWQRGIESFHGVSGFPSPYIYIA